MNDNKTLIGVGLYYRPPEDVGPVLDALEQTEVLPGKLFELVPEPENEFDQGAVAIVYDGRHHVGYVRAEQTHLVHAGWHVVENVKARKSGAYGDVTHLYMTVLHESVLLMPETIRLPKRSRARL
ncbi:MAG: hypothetical protein ABW072_02250 [Sedimenticola sp.]